MFESRDRSNATNVRLSARASRFLALAVVSLPAETLHPMTQSEVAYRYGNPPTEAEMRAISALREVYGIRRITFDPKPRTVRVEFDASRFKEPVIAALLREAGLDLREKLVLA